METKVHFEQLDIADRVQGITQLLLRRNRLTPPVLVICPDDEFMHKLDDTLWTIHPEAFLPHGIATSDRETNAKQPILLATAINRSNEPQVLINGGLEIPTDISGFTHIVDFVDAWDEDLKQASRERFKTYRQLSLSPTYLVKKNPT
ncbi:MAG: DNA polymerase III subunit chi [Ghiorsea sp.]